MGKVVVGVDGSTSSQAALHWARDEAALRGDDLEAVVAWRETYFGGSGFNVDMPDPGIIQDAAKAMIEAAIDSASTGGGDPPMHGVVVEGHPGRTLLEHAKGADMLVVGARGHGGFSGLRLGSVSTYCVHHAPCPVVVVPAEGDESQDG